MADCIKLELPGLDERYVQLTKRQYINATASNSTNTTNTNSVTTITTMTKGTKVKYSGNLRGRGKVD
jgi:hypothetical protein